MNYAADGVVIELEREAGALTVPELVSRTGLPASDVGEAVRELEASGVLVTSGERVALGAEGLRGGPASVEAAPSVSGGLTIGSLLSSVTRVTAEVELVVGEGGVLVVDRLLRVLSVKVGD